MNKKDLKEKDNIINVNVNYVNESEEPAEPADSSANVIAYVLLFVFFIVAVWYISPWLTSIGSVFKLVLTTVCAAYVYQCIKWFLKCLRDA